MNQPDYILDAGRLAALDSYGILDTPAEPGFDDIVQLAAQICDTPVALVSLVAADRQWFKARIGFELCETGLDGSVCAHALIEPDLLVITDLTKDRRTSANPLVTGEPHIRFYAGAPFRAASGEVLGSLCVIDSTIRPGGLTDLQASGLRNLARQVTNQLDLRRAIAERDGFVAEQRLAERRRNALMHMGDRLREMTTVADMTRIATAIVGETVNVSRAAYGRLDENAEYVLVEPDWTAPGVTSVAGRHRLEDFGELREGLLRGEPLIVEDATIDARTAAKFEASAALNMGSFVNMPVRHRGRTVAILIVHSPQPQVWSREILTFLRNVADRLEVGIARLEAEADQRLLNHELGHRLKNTFAMIQALATQTLRAVPDQQPVATFIQRLHALSAAHDVLLDQKMSAASIGAVVRSVLHTLVDIKRFEISGTQIDLGPRAALSLSLLLHELATNAMKYGSLSVDGGHVAIGWRVDGDHDDAELVLVWREIGGPPARQTSKKGFGSKLIQMGLVGTGGVDLRYLTAGFEADFRAPLAQIEFS